MSCCDERYIVGAVRGFERTETPNPSMPLAWLLASSAIGSFHNDGESYAYAAPTTVPSCTGDFCFVAKWRGYHDEAPIVEDPIVEDSVVEDPMVGLCTATLIAPLWIMTAAHCAVRYLHNETVHARVIFGEGGDLKRSVVSCVHAQANTSIHSKGEDTALCKLKRAIHQLPPVRLNADLYTSAGAHGKPVYCVGTRKGYHVVGPKPLLYEPSGGHLFVNNSNGSGMHAGDSGGAWLHMLPSESATPAEYVQSGVIHGSAGHGLGAACQPSFIREWIDQVTGMTVSWVSVGPVGPVEHADDARWRSKELIVAAAPPLLSSLPLWYRSLRFHAHTRLHINGNCKQDEVTRAWSCNAIFENAAQLLMSIGVPAYVRHTHTGPEGLSWPSTTDPRESWHQLVQDTGRNLPQEFLSKANASGVRVIFYHYMATNPYYADTQPGWVQRWPNGTAIRWQRGIGLSPCADAWVDTYVAQVYPRAWPSHHLT